MLSASIYLSELNDLVPDVVPINYDLNNSDGSETYSILKREMDSPVNKNVLRGIDFLPNPKVYEFRGGTNRLTDVFPEGDVPEQIRNVNRMSSGNEPVFDPEAGADLLKNQPYSAPASYLQRVIDHQRNNFDLWKNTQNSLFDKISRITPQVLKKSDADVILNRPWNIVDGTSPNAQRGII